MQTKLMRIVVGLLAAGAAVAALAQIKWVPTYKAALKQAKTTKKIVMIEFYTAWDLDPNYVKDSPGQKLENDTFKDPYAQKVANKFVPVRLNVEKEGKELGKKFHITNYPTVLFVDSNENAVGIIDGYEDATEFIKHGNQFIKDYADMPKMESALKHNSKNLAAIARLGTIYANRYQIATALAHLKKAEEIDPKNGTDRLSGLYNAVGDYYQSASQFDSAIPYFQKSADTAKTTDDRAYGYLSIVTCYLTIDPPDSPKNANRLVANMKKSVPMLQACLGLPKLKDDDKKLAEQMLRLATAISNSKFPDDGGGD